jgi:hypothetical protein
MSLKQGRSDNFCYRQITKFLGVYHKFDSPLIFRKNFDEKSLLKSEIF